MQIPILIKTGTLWLSLMLVWVVALFGVLRIHHVSGTLTHSFCGVWGCGPPTEALISYHGFWFVLMLPPVIGGIWYLPVEWLKTSGLVLFAIGALGVTAILSWAAYDWLANAADFQKQFVVNRCVLVLVSLIDLPVMQLGLYGAVLFVAGRFRGLRKPRKSSPLANERTATQEDLSNNGAGVINEMTDTTTCHTAPVADSANSYPADR